MDNCNINGEMLTIDQKVNNNNNYQMNSINFNGNNNTLQITETINNLVLNGCNNKIFVSSKIYNILLNGNKNQINVLFPINLV